MAVDTVHPVLANYIRATCSSPGPGCAWPDSDALKAALKERAEQEQAAAAVHWTGRLAKARAAHAHLSTGAYLRLLFGLNPQPHPDFLAEEAEDYSDALFCVREAMLRGNTIESLRFPARAEGPCFDSRLECCPWDCGSVFDAYHMFSFRHKRYRCPTFDLGLGWEENPDSYESWAGFAEAVLALVATAEAEARQSAG